MAYMGLKCNKNEKNVKKVLSNIVIYVKMVRLGVYLFLSKKKSRLCESYLEILVV